MTDARQELKVRNGLIWPLVGLWVVTVCVALLALDARATYGARVSADEPQYLLTAISLAEDLDLDISDEIADERFRPFHEVSLNQQTIDLNDDGQRLSPHDPLLPILLAPAVAIGGWAGAKTMLAILAGWTAVLTAWTAVRRLGVGPRPAVVVTGALFVTPPLTAYGTQVYPEMAAALATIGGVSALLGLLGNGSPGQDRTRTVGLEAVVVLAIVALPWLSVKYVPVAGVLAATLLWSAVGASRYRRAVVLSGLLAVAGAGYLVLHQQIYGGWTVYAAGDHFVDGEFQVVGADPDYLGRSRRIVGLLLDNRFGLIPWSPAFVALPASLVFLLRSGLSPGVPTTARRLPVAVLATGWAVATWVALTMHGWWWPGRQLVVVLPMAVLAMTVLADRCRPIFVAVCGLSAVAMANWLWLAAEASTDRRTLIVDFFETNAVPYRLLHPLFPDYATFGWSDQVVTVVWIIAVAAGTAVLTRRSQSAMRDRGSGQTRQKTPTGQPPSGSSLSSSTSDDTAATATADGSTTSGMATSRR